MARTEEIALARFTVAALVTAALVLLLCGGAQANPVTRENALRGSGGWGFREPPLSAAAGYAELSVAPGATLHLHASAPSDRYRVEVWRLGWYGGTGGRRVACVPAGCDADRPPVVQPAPPPPDNATGLVNAGWQVTDAISVGGDWVSGYYVAIIRLTTGAYAGEGYRVPFIVRAAAGRRARILVQASVNTWEAYNPWGGKSLYGYNSTDRVPAAKVSFLRPFDHAAGNTSPLSHEIQLVRFLEREGYDVAYQTDADAHVDPASLQSPRVVVVNGHGEYWTHEMRAGFDAARDAGQSLVFAGADIGYWQVRYEDAGATLVGYKSRRDPIADPRLETIAFRNLTPPQPECELVGVQYTPVPDSAGPKLLYGSDYVVVADPAETPWLAGTGLTAGRHLPGLVGYEWDSPVAGCGPPGAKQVFVAPGAQPAAAVRYDTPRGGRVLSVGSMFFKYGLDDYGSRTAVIPEVQAFMRNVLDDMAGRSARGLTSGQVRVLSVRRRGKRRVSVRLRASDGIVRDIRISVRTRRGGRRIGRARVRRLTKRARRVIVRVRRPLGRHARVIVTAGEQRVVRRIALAV